MATATGSSDARKARKGLYFAVSLLVLACSSQAWAQARAGSPEKIGAPVAPSAFGVAAPALSPQLLSSVFPGLRSSARPLEESAAVRRVFAAAQLETSGPGAIPAERVAEAVTAYAEGLSAEVARQNRTTDDPLRVVRERIALTYRLQDATAALALMGGREETVQALNRDAAELQSGLSVRGDALVKEALALLPAATNASWHGRTAVVPVGEDGSAIALKFERDGKSVKDEVPGVSRMARLSARLGMETPLPLTTGSGDVLPLEGEARVHGTAVTAYLLPGKLGSEFFSYLGDRLPEGWSRKQRTEAVRTSAMRAVDGMILLFENGWHHETLTPLSHSKTAYAWHHWREKQTDSLFEIERFGPTSIHDWSSGLEHANVRLSGLADFEHLKAFDGDDDRGRQQRREAVGQNLFELSLLVMRAGYRNGIGAGEIASILTEAIQRHAAGIDAATGVETEIDAAFLSARLRRAVRNFYAFHFVADHLPRFVVRRYNDWVAAHATSKFIPPEAALVMSGEIVHVLAMDILRPYAEALIGGAPLWETGSINHIGRWERWWRMAGDPLMLYAANRTSPNRTETPFAKAAGRVIYPALALFYGLETGPYADWGRIRKSWVWRAGEDPGAEARRRKIGVLVGRQEARFLPAIERGLSDPDPLVREFARKALEERRDAGSLPLIARMIDGEDAEARLSAISALWGREDARSLTLLLKAVRHPDERVQIAAAGLLSSRKDADSIPLTIVDELLHHPRLCRHAAGILRNLRDAASLPLIERARRYDDGLVREAAERAWNARHPAQQ